MPFRQPSQPSGGGGSGADIDPGTFDLLGFTHYWGKSLRGNWVVKRKTARSRFTQAVRMIARWRRMNRHLPVREQHRALSQKLRGHYAYYGITGNGTMLSRFREQVGRWWRKWLGRRKRGNPMTWPRFAKLRERYPLPAARVVHSVYRAQRTDELRSWMR